VFKLALSETRASRKLALGHPDAVSQMANLADDPGPSEIVETVEYDQLATKEELGVSRVVKIDVEGHEFAALKGRKGTLSSPMCAATFCAIHPSMLASDVGAPRLLS
jgi:FkbM family methyltransferase